MLHASNYLRWAAISLLVVLSSSSSAHADSSIIDIDNDQLIEIHEAQIAPPVATDASGAKAVTGAQFPVVLTSELSSKTVRVGDPVTARLKYDLKIGDRLIATRGSTVVGHVGYALPARSQIRSIISKHRCTMTSGCVGIKFDELINENQDHFSLVAKPAAAPAFVSNKSEGRLLGINQKGEIAGPYSMQLRNLALRASVSAAMAPLGPMSFGAVPVALGVIGAVNPSFAFGKPVGYNVRHRRVKGFFLGALYGVPGGFLLQGSAVKGEEVVIKPGDEFLAELSQDFNGLPATEVELMAGVDTKVHAEVLKTF